MMARFLSDASKIENMTTCRLIQTPLPLHDLSVRIGRQGMRLIKMECKCLKLKIMKKYTFVIFLGLTIFKSQAQDYLLSFAGSGATTEIDTIKVDNLTSGTTVTLNGGDILHLTSAAGIVSRDIANGALQIYPNPVIGQSMLTFNAPESGNAVICLVDLSGKTVYQKNTLLSRGTNIFLVSGINQGLYFVKVTGKNYSSSTKLVSLSNLQNRTVIEDVSSENNIPDSHLKSVEATVDMPYTNGDQLLFKGISGIYSTIVTDVPVSSKTITFNFAACTDYDGNNYTIVEIGSQTWMAENLNVGTRINGSVSQTNNGIIEKYCYDDNDANCAVYGGLYQWLEARQYLPQGQGICPTGWHFSTDAEWTTLTNNLGGGSVAGGNMKETGTSHWLSPNTSATNHSGFTAIPGGLSYNGGFGNLTLSARFWTSDYFPTSWAICRSLQYNDDKVIDFMGPETIGYSVRCIKD
jgi:uncharacterized protein (TIGR02145 family)